MTAERVDFEAVFRAFAERSQTLGPSEGALDHWRRGRARYAVWVVRLAVAPAVHERMARVAAAVGDAIVPIPASEAHVTAFVAGFPCDGDAVHDDDVPWRVLDEQAGALGDALGQPLALHVGGANAFASCVFLDVHDASGGLARARELLARAHREVRFAPYAPHVTVGRFRDTRAAAPIAAQLARLRDEEPPIALRIDAIELVTFDATHDGHPELVTERVVRLGARR